MKVMLTCLVLLTLISCQALKDHDPMLKYNYMENKYEQVPENSELRYNYMERKWEYVPK